MNVALDTFTKSYIGAVLWLCDELEDYSRDDFAPETLEIIINDCRKFQDLAGNMITEENYISPVDYSSSVVFAGHDFFLTRNRYGAGFWDGDWHPSVSDRLTKIANQFGEIDFYVGNDGKIYC